jgi:DNA-binding response OmpR family regulator
MDMSRLPSILIVDDSADNRAQLEFFLQMMGYRIVVAESGNQALKLLKKSKFDIVLSDIQMPDGSGLELLRSMRSGDDFTPVLIMTARTDIAAEHILSMGGDGFIRKPLNLEKLLVLLIKIQRAGDTKN